MFNIGLAFSGCKIYHPHPTIFFLFLVHLLKRYSKKYIKNGTQVYMQPLKELEPVPYFIPTPAHGMAVARNILVDIKGYGSDQSEFRVVVAFEAAEPMALRVLVVGEHACRTAMWP